MLTGDLVRAKVSGDTLIPQRIDPAKVHGDAAALVALFRDALEGRRARGDLEEEIDDLCADRRDHRVLRGLAKLCFDRSTFDVASPIVPAALRAEAFARAAELGPLSLSAGPLGRTTADDVLGPIAAARGLTVTDLREALYADLDQARRLVGFDVPDPDWLLHRYNVAQVQALLLRAVEVTVRLQAPSAARMRQLFRTIKFFQLIHAARRTEEGLVVTLDGPTSLFAQSTRYGLQLASFFPALLHLDSPWTLEASVTWTRANHRKRVVLDHRCGLVGHYADRGGYRTREQEWFADRFTALGSDWTLAEGGAPITLADHGVVWPDFTFVRDGRTAHLEILGYWRHEDLGKKLSLLARYGPGNLVLAVSRRLRGSREALADEPPVPVIDFAEVVPAREVLAVIARIAKEES